MISHMPRVNAILKSSKYQKWLKIIEQAEQERKFCRHTMEHFLDTARIMYIISLEEKLGINKEVIYAVALIHDIGRAMEYERNIPHNHAGSQFAEEVLAECGFSHEEVNAIAGAIFSHRNGLNYENSLGRLLYKADKLSRLCFNCKAEKECYWQEDKKNFEIVY